MHVFIGVQSKSFITFQANYAILIVKIIGICIHSADFKTCLKANTISRETVSLMIIKYWTSIMLIDIQHQKAKSRFPKQTCMAVSGGGSLVEAAENSYCRSVRTYIWLTVEFTIYCRIYPVYWERRFYKILPVENFIHAGNVKTIFGTAIKLRLSVPWNRSCPRIWKGCRWFREISIRCWSLAKNKLSCYRNKI